MLSCCFASHSNSHNADDQGWDDIGLNHPRVPGSLPDFINTPNLDKFLQQSTRFDNFYVAPMCSHSRASLLTGRDFPRTGTMLVNVSVV
jgi:arylsulfatase